MTLHSHFYEENLYLLQDGAIAVINRCPTRFYLTGGTALSRAYYNHRYSDDLDFFLNEDASFEKQAKTVIAELKKEGFLLNEKASVIAERFISIEIMRSSNTNSLKIDFINDITAHFGGIKETSFFKRTDSIRNILSNKVSALFRFAEKDLADIREICLNESFNWEEIINEAYQKDSGVDVTAFAKILKSMPESKFNDIKWIKPVLWSDFASDMETIALDLLKGSDNSLVKKQ
ncbi:MAG: nucleotidyl transferase AbiEii/AbiGii toxin family protein [Elusimicrobiota bacterium]|jgi:predicted nucleotidyltransferase component of viral defense system|nr:nucleotidyl transferase AbiEii/AbiGii toxin family protein [Elusimicrobiota bacterium]